jgi:hypothetical protein
LLAGFSRRFSRTCASTKKGAPWGKEADFAHQSTVVDKGLADWESAAKALQFLTARASAFIMNANIDQKRGGHPLFLWIKQQADTLNPLQDLEKFISKF